MKQSDTEIEFDVDFRIGCQTPSYGQGYVLNTDSYD